MRRTNQALKRQRALQGAVEQVGLTTAARHEARLRRGALSAVREDFAAAEAALDGAIVAAEAGGTSMRLVLDQLRTRQQKLLLASMSDDGVRVPTCARTASLAAEGPDIAGMGAGRRFPPGPVRAGLYGLDLTAALDPAEQSSAAAASSWP